MLALAAGEAVGRREIGLSVVADDLQDGFVGAGGVFVLHVKDRIDGMIAHERAKAILQPPSCIEGRIAAGSLSVEIEFGCPPGAGAIFQLHRRGAVAATA